MVEQSQKLKPVGRAGVVGACLFALLLIVGMEFQQHRGDARAPSPPSDSISPKLPEVRLAAIQLGHLPRAGQPVVIRLSWLLDLLAADCTGNTRRDLADLTVASLRELRMSGISASPAAVLGGVTGMEDIGRLPRCQTYFERYVASRRSADVGQQTSS